jgi:hypothetical protein
MQRLMRATVVVLLIGTLFLYPLLAPPQHRIDEAHFQLITEGIGLWHPARSSAVILLPTVGTQATCLCGNNTSCQKQARKPTSICFAHLVDAAWKAEIKRRVEAFERGEVTWHSGDEVLRELKKKCWESSA